MVPALKNLTYIKRLEALKLPTLVFRRLRGDMIEVYKLLTGKYDIDTTQFFTPAIYRGTRGNQYKIYKPGAKKKKSLKFFTHRVIANWNALPDSVVTAKTTNTFKNRLDRHWQNHPNKFDFEAKVPQARHTRTFQVLDIEDEPGIQD